MSDQIVGLDTNVLVRFIMQDDPSQSSIANRLIESLGDDETGFVSLIALVETVWVLTGCYDAKRTDIVRVVTALLQSRELTLQDSDIVSRAVKVYDRGNADFADCLIEISGSAVGCRHTFTFDQKAMKSTGMVLLSA